jgi:predicted nucleic acid-binding protein
MMYLLDTQILTELRKRERDAGLAAWLSGKSDGDLFVSVISVGELTKEIAQLDMKDRAFAGTLGHWLEKLLLVHGERVLPVDISVAKRWGDLTARAHSSDADILLAATAIENGLSIVTRDEKRFAWTGAKVMNPWR